MSYKTILTYAETAEDLEKIMPIAMMIAKDHGAHIIGLHVIHSPSLLADAPYVTDLLLEAEKRVQEAARERAGALRKTFESHVGSEADAVGEWRAVISDSPDLQWALIEHARCCDLVIMAQPDPSTDRTGRIGTLGETILQSGRPVLVVPYAGIPGSVGKYAFVAWNGSRESARAVFDALPFLREAKEVRVYGIGGKARNEATLPGAELATTLSRHGVNTIAETVPDTGLSVADTLLSRLADHGADLLVMGGYGHSRAREYVFGGATRDILKTMTVPVLLSH